jgi:Ni/Fe-hydrogenase subunit HybB-like protein
MIREAYVHLFDGSVASYAFVAELGLGVILPFALLLSDRVRRSPVGLLLASTLVVGGVALNRVNVFLVAYNPPFATTRYFPSLSEIFITVGLVAGLVFMYRTLVMLFPILPEEEESQVYEASPSREPLQVRTDPYALS